MYYHYLSKDQLSAIHNLQSTLARLRQNQTSIQAQTHILQNLQKQHQIKAIMKQDFAALKGKLSWPTEGSVLPYFGIPIDQSELKWDGILIRAAEDQPVYAVASDKVVFAKWFPGYGLLLIINHGHAYMTLYGRNHNLYKKPGDMVQKGDLVATVGQSGGYEKPSALFCYSS